MNSRVSVGAMNGQVDRAIRAASHAFVRGGDGDGVNNVPALATLKLLRGQGHSPAATRQIPVQNDYMHTTHGLKRHAGRCYGG